MFFFFFFQFQFTTDLKKDGFHRFSSLAVLVQRLGRTYFHWLTGALPRLVQYLDVLKDEPTALARLRYLVYDEPFVVDALTLLGVDVRRQIIFFDSNSVYSAETLYASSSTPCGQPSRPTLLHVKKHVYNTLYPMPGPGAPRAVIERNQRRLKYANRRGLIIVVNDKRMKNMNEITNTIRKWYVEEWKKKTGLNVEIVIVGSGRSGSGKGSGGSGNGNGNGRSGNGRSRSGIESESNRRRPNGGNGGGNDGRRNGVTTMSGVKGTLLAEYSLWRRAELVVGLTSELLSNIIWCQSGTKVVELMPILPMSKGRRASLTYADMAGSLDLTYALVPMETSNVASNMTVPIPYLESALKLVME